MVNKTDNIEGFDIEDYGEFYVVKGYDSISYVKRECCRYETSMMLYHEVMGMIPSVYERPIEKWKREYRIK